MDGVRAPPEIVGRQRQHADHAPDPVVGETMAEECAMTAIVLDHEQAHEKAGGRHRKQQAKPVAKIERCPHQKPEQSKRHGRDDELD